jgi:hypothetical protein
LLDKLEKLRRAETPLLVECWFLIDDEVKELRRQGFLRLFGLIDLSCELNVGWHGWLKFASNEEISMGLKMDGLEIAGLRF